MDFYLRKKTPPTSINIIPVTTNDSTVRTTLKYISAPTINEHTADVQKVRDNISSPF